MWDACFVRDDLWCGGEAPASAEGNARASSSERVQGMVLQAQRKRCNAGDPCSSVLSSPRHAASDDGIAVSRTLAVAQIVPHDARQISAAARMAIFKESRVSRKRTCAHEGSASTAATPAWRTRCRHAVEASSARVARFAYVISAHESYSSAASKRTECEMSVISSATGRGGKGTSL